MTFMHAIEKSNAIATSSVIYCLDCIDVPLHDFHKFLSPLIKDFLGLISDSFVGCTI